MQTKTAAILEKLRQGSQERHNFTLKQRLHHLQLLENTVKANEQLFFEALGADFNKPEFETFLTEIIPVLDEIRQMRKRLKSWIKPQRKPTTVLLFPASSRLYYEPKGTVLVIGAWNYPVTLTLVPLVGALAAGNTVLLKPSEIASHTSALLFRILNEAFPETVLRVVEGNGERTSEILDHKFDHIFYTGSARIGKLVYEKAAVQLCSVTLELGGKSPAIFHSSAHLPKAVKRLLWGKFLNGGQTCVAPDYVLVPEKIREKFLDQCRLVLNEFQSPPSEQASIVNDKNLKRILSLLDDDIILHFGGESDAQTRWIAPTIVEIRDIRHPLMSEEIFGPVLPVYFYRDVSEIGDFYRHNPDPLALYIFSRNSDFTENILLEYPSGGVMINDVILHIANVHLPFGGRGSSGFGNYHGVHSFRTFSHARSIMQQSPKLDLPFRYRPYSAGRLRFLRRLFHWLGNR